MKPIELQREADVDVLGLDSLPEPFRDGKHAWFAIGQGKQLHIIEGATNPTDQPKRNHTCFRIASLQDFITRLTKAGFAYEDLQGTPGAIKLRPDGIQQIYFRDPDGYWVEMKFVGSRPRKKLRTSQLSRSAVSWIPRLGAAKRCCAMSRRTFATRVIESSPHKGKAIDVEVDTHVSGNIEFASGAIATLIASFDVWDCCCAPSTITAGRACRARLRTPNGQKRPTSAACMKQAIVKTAGAGPPIWRFARRRRRSLAAPEGQRGDASTRHLTIPNYRHGYLHGRQPE
jgi:hypothetical protein